MIRGRTIRTVASFEFVSTIKRKGYLIATFGMPIFVLLYGAVISSVGFFMVSKENEVKVYGVVDHAEVLELGDEETEVARELPEELRTAVEAMGQQDALGQPLAWWSNFVFRPYPGADRAKVDRFGMELVPLVTSGPPGVTGFAGGRPKATEVIGYWPALLDKSQVKTQVQVEEVR